LLLLLLLVMMMRVMVVVLIRVLTSKRLTTKEILQLGSVDSGLS
jgi:hypothetical protein